MKATSRYALIGLLLVLILGFWLRLDQFTVQVLLDDEWHAVHQLLRGLGPSDMFFNFGHADYSIPLGMLYWLQAHWFGLGELAMRWPMLMAGLGLLLLFARVAWRTFSPGISVVVTLLLAGSPMLVIYSHTARPYALTLLFSYLALFSFYRCLNTDSRAVAWGSAYSVCAAMTAWLHPVISPFVIAPLLLEGARWLGERKPGPARKLLGMAAGSAALAIPLVVPPLLAGTESLTSKLGQTGVNAGTIKGVWFFWLGTPSAAVLAVLLVLAALGIARLLKSDRAWQAALLGIALTALLIVFMRPASVSNPGTFGRYLLPAMPLLFLSIACGLERMLNLRAPLKQVFSVVAMGVLAVLVVQSPLWELNARPNTNMTHSRFQAGFRQHLNPIIAYQQKALPVSAFWSSLAAHPPATLRIAVAPFYFATYHWDGPRWEQASRQTTLPAFINSFCADQRPGEAPSDDRFRFRNAYHMTGLVDPDKPRPDWIVFTLPIPGFEGTPEGRAMQDEADLCLSRLREQLGPPVYQDGVLQAWRTGTN
jgi:hypothetical protein